MSSPKPGEKSRPGTYRYLQPRMAERLRGVEIAVRRPMDGSHQGLHKSPAFGSSVEFAEYREYIPGDPISRIDWPVYARSDRYVIRQYHEDVSIRCCIMLDTSASMKYHQGGLLSKMEYACHLTGGMMYLMAQQGDSVSLITFDNKIRQYHEPAGSFAGLKPMLLALEELEARNKGDIESALHDGAELIKGKALVIVISDLLEEPKNILRGLGHLYHNGKETTLFHILDPAELRLPQEGLVDVTNLETPAKLTVDLNEIREEYMRQFHLYLDELRAGCANVRTDYILAETGKEIYDILLARSRLI
ncbi:MAG: DUF58 domain-containing protein [Sedimentisphaerales bacterium]|nr:DUF58 domain-containing protein [Sedimentisphaerales bacterium]